MAKYLVLHKVGSKYFVGGSPMERATPAQAKQIIDTMTPELNCVRTISAIGAGLMICEWEAASEQAILDLIAKAMPEIPVDGIYPAQVLDWAEAKKKLEAALAHA